MHSAIFLAILFFILSPGVFVRFPKSGSKMMVAGVHAAIFALIWIIVRKFGSMYLPLEGMKEGAKDIKPKSDNKPKGDSKPKEDNKPKDDNKPKGGGGGVIQHSKKRAAIPPKKAGK